VIKREVHAYKNNEVSTASKLRLIIMMYDGVIHYLEACKKKAKEGDIAGRGLYISKAQRVIGELQESLNRQQGGDVARNLEKLYSYINASLTKANIDGDVTVIDQCIQILGNLRTAWAEVMANSPRGKGEDSNGSNRVTIQM
jgi:flagellar protein FliS